MKVRVDPLTGLPLIQPDTVAHGGGGGGGTPLPDQTGNAGKYLKTDGTTASWATVSGGGGGTGTVETIVAGSNIDVDSTDPANPIVSVETLTTADVADSADKRYVTDAQLTVIGNTSGTNTGDQDLSGYATTSSLATVATSGSYSDLSGTPTIPDELADLDTTVTGAQLDSLKSKVDGIESGAEVNNISDANATDLTDGGDTTLHYHATDRDRANHTGTQAISTVSGLQTELDDKLESITGLITAGSNVTITGSGTSGSPYSIAASGGGGGGGAVDSVNGQTGVVVLDADDIDDSSTTNKFATATQLSNADSAVQPGDLATVATTGDYDDLTNTPSIPTQYTDENAQDAVGTILTDSSEIDFTYDDATPSITASLKASSIDESKLDASVNASLDLADSAVQDLSDLGITATATELNYTDGVTSAIQTQLDGKAASSHTHTEVDITDLGNYLESVDISDINATGTPGSGNFLRGDGTWTAPSGSGDVVGPASVADNRLAAFDGTTGKLLKDSGYSAGAIFTYIDDEVAGKADASHTHTGADITGTGKSATTFLRGDNTWVTPTNTTYSEISEANIENTTSSTVGLITGRRAEALMDNEASKTRTLTNKTIDAASNTVTNVASLSVKRQNNTTNSTVTGARIETGWGVIAYNTGAIHVSEAVTFNTAFSTAPIVTITFGGDSPAGTSYGNGGNSVEGMIIIKAHTITTSGFTAHLWKPVGGNLAAGNGFYQWIAIGS